jgi:hypothetical protein
MLLFGKFRVNSLAKMPSAKGTTFCYIMFMELIMSLWCPKCVCVPLLPSYHVLIWECCPYTITHTVYFCMDVQAVLDFQTLDIRTTRSFECKKIDTLKSTFGNCPGSFRHQQTNKRTLWVTECCVAFLPTVSAKYGHQIKVWIIQSTRCIYSVHFTFSVSSSWHKSFSGTSVLHIDVSSALMYMTLYQQ